MTGKEFALDYHPTWDNVGDADNFLIAIAYGIIAMGTIWTIERLFDRLLFSAGLDLSVAEASSLVVLKGCSWVDIVQWLRTKKREKKLLHISRRETANLNKKALASMLFRFLIVILDICVIFASLPRSITLKESDVGSSQLNFLQQGQKLIRVREIGTREDSLSPCLRDRTIYKGFVASAVRQVCWRRKGLIVRSRDSRRGTFTFVHNRSTQTLRLVSFMERRVYEISHNVQFAALFNASAPLSLRLPLPGDIAVQAAETIFRNQKYSSCKKKFKVRAKRDMVSFKCDEKSKTGARIGSYAMLQELLLVAAFTRKAPGSLNKKSISGAQVYGDFIVGTANRPLICIFPSLIILAILIFCDVILRLVCGKERILVNLFQLLAEELDLDSPANPLYITDKVLPFNTEDKTDAWKLTRQGYLRKELNTEPQQL